MKILAVGLNYPLHIEELASHWRQPIGLPVEPIFFLKGDVPHRKGYPFFYPDFSTEIEYETEVVIRIDRIGKHIDERFAHRYYSQVALGLDLTARDVQRDAKANGLPWTKAKAFEDSAIVGDWIPKDTLGDMNNLGFYLDIDGHTVQRGNTRDMIFSIDKLIAYASRIFTLRTGDIIYTGTPAGVGSITIGQTLTGYIGGNKNFELCVK